MVLKKVILVVKLLMIFVILSILCASQTVIAAEAYYKCSDGKYFSLTSTHGGADLVFSGSNKIEKLRFEGARTDSNANFSFHMGSQDAPSTLAYIRNGKVIKEVDCEEIDKSSYPKTTSSAKSAVAAASERVQRSSAATKRDTSPCQGVTQTKGDNIKNKAALERVIAQQLKRPSVTLLSAYARDNWTVLLVNANVSGDDNVYLFYSGNPLTNRYVTMLEVAYCMNYDMPRINELVLKRAPGIPPKLANCWAWSVTH